MLQINRLEARAMCSTLGDDTTTLDGAKLRLLKGDVAITPFTEWADLTEADFAGYAGSATLSWNAATIDASGNGQVTAPTVTFLADDTITVAGVVTGLAYTHGTSPVVLIAAEPLARPVSIAAPGDFVRVDPIFSFPGVPTTHVEGPNGTVQG